MLNKKAVTSMIISIVLLLNMLLVVNGSVDTSKADTLNTLNIVLGDGNDYMLDSTTERSHAITFIVRMLGAEKEVLENSETYAKTTFSDVKESDWFAPYVGYVVSQGIVDGFPDNTFKPNDPISEKAFLKLLLGMLNYEYDNDYDWDTVYEKAYELGLISSIKSEDNYNYVRQGSINVMYNALSLHIKGSEQSELERLVDKGVVTKEDAMVTGLWIEKVVTEIESVTAIAPNEIKIILTNPVKDISLEDVLVTEEKKESNELALVEIIEQQGKTIVIKTDLQKEEVDYEVKLSNLVALQGSKLDDLSSEFIGYVETSEVNSDYYHISKVQAISKNRINVEFTQPISASAVIPLYITLKQGNDIIVEPSFEDMSTGIYDDYTATIWLDSKSLKAGEEYTLEISGDSKSRYSCYLNDGNGESYDFIGTGRANESFYIESIETIKEDYIRIIFSDYVDTATATKNSNYSVNKIGSEVDYPAFDVVSTGTGDLKNKQFDVRFSLNNDEEYELSVEDIDNFLKAQTVDEDDKYGFSHYYSEDDAFKLEGAAALDKRHIVLYFDNPVDESTVSSSAYIFSGPSIVSKELDEESPYQVHLYLSSDLNSDSTYTMKVASLKDVYGTTVDDSISISIRGSDEEREMLSMYSAVFVDSNKVKVNFRKGISSTNSASNFRLKYKDDDGDDQYINAKSFSLVDDTTAVITFRSIDDDEDYKLEGLNVRLVGDNIVCDKTSTSVH